MTTGASVGRVMHEASVGCSELAALFDPGRWARSRLRTTQSCFAFRRRTTVGSLCGTLFVSVLSLLVLRCV